MMMATATKKKLESDRAIEEAFQEDYTKQPQAMTKEDVDAQDASTRKWQSLGFAYGNQIDESNKAYDKAYSQADRHATSRGMGRSSYNEQTLANIGQEKINAQNKIYGQQIADYQNWMDQQAQQDAENEWRERQYTLQLRQIENQEKNDDWSHGFQEAEAARAQGNLDRDYDLNKGQIDYARQRDTIADKRYEDELAYARSRDTVADKRYEDELAYARSRDTVADQRYADELAYARGRDEVADRRYENEFAYQKAKDELAQKNYENERDYSRTRDTVADKRYEDELAYSRKRDDVNDARYADELAYARSRDAVNDARYADELAYARGRDTVNDARYADELAYARSRDTVNDARYADELAYARGRDTVNDARYADELAYARSRDTVNDARYADELAYARGRDTVNDARYADELAYSRGRDAVSDARYADELAYSRERDAISDEFRERQYADSRADTAWQQGMTEKQWNAQQAQWREEFDYNKMSDDQKIAYNYVTTAIQQKKNVSDELLARAGISRKDFNSMIGDVQMGAPTSVNVKVDTDKIAAAVSAASRAASAKNTSNQTDFVNNLYGLSTLGDASEYSGQKLENYVEIPKTVYDKIGAKDQDSRVTYVRKDGKYYMTKK